MLQLGLRRQPLHPGSPAEGLVVPVGTAETGMVRVAQSARY